MQPRGSAAGCGGFAFAEFAFASFPRALLGFAAGGFLLLACARAGFRFAFLDLLLGFFFDLLGVEFGLFQARFGGVFGGLFALLRRAFGREFPVAGFDLGEDFAVFGEFVLFFAVPARFFGAFGRFFAPFGRRAVAARGSGGGRAAAAGCKHGRREHEREQERLQGVDSSQGVVRGPAVMDDAARRPAPSPF